MKIIYFTTQPFEKKWYLYLSETSDCEQID